MTTLERHVKTLILLSQDGDSCSYNEENKKKFATAARYVAKELAKVLRLSRNSYEIRYNKAGIAVSGEITLHGDWIYVQFDIGSMAPRFMWRTCDGRKDYTGHVNQWSYYKSLSDLDGLAKRMKLQRPVTA